MLFSLQMTLWHGCCITTTQVSGLKNNRWLQGQLRLSSFWSQPNGGSDSIALRQLNPIH